MAEARLLIVEDDANLGQILKEYLEIKGFETDWARDGEEGLDMFLKNVYDLCILDIMMPKKDGFTLAKEMLNSSRGVPFMFLTAKSLKEDTITGFKIGADDYLTKPFSMEELLMRIRVILRRSAVTTEEADLTKIQVGRSILNYDKQLLMMNGKSISLTSKESDLLKLLSQYKNKVLDRKLALKLIWSDDSYFNARSMDVYIAKLRKHLKLDPSVEIVTIHGKGFKLVDSN